MKKQAKAMTKRALAVLLAIATMIAFSPVFDCGVYAQSQSSDAETYYALPDEGNDSGFVAEDEAFTKEELNAQMKAPGDAAKMKEEPVELTDALQNVPADGIVADEVLEANAVEEPVSEYGLANDDASDPAETIAAMEEETEDGEEALTAQGLGNFWMSVSVGANGNVKVSATTDSDDVYFTDLYVDDREVYSAYVYGERDISGVAIDMKNYPVGYHTVKLYLAGNCEPGLYMYYDHVKTNIYAAPKLSLGNFYSGYNYFSYRDGYNYYSYDSNCNVYLDYKRNNEGWRVGYGPVGAGGSGQISRLYAASWYSVRAYYAKVTSYTPPNKSAERHVFKGPISNGVGFKTGLIGTPVKAIKAKKVKQWCKKIKVRRLSNRVYYRNGYAGWGYYRKVLGTKTYKYWYTKIKVTVKMSRVPGVAGIYIGSKRVGGNKKTYSTKFILSGKKKGKKVAVSVYSYMNPTYGGWSGKTLKKVKVK